MKMSKIKIAVVSLILCVVAIISLGTLAWFTDTDTIDNKLKFVTDFEMDLYETIDNGTAKFVVDNETIGRTYENITPGMFLHKDPTVVNKSSVASQYIRMTVTVDKAFDWAKHVTSGTDLTSVFSGFDATDWTRYDDPITDGKAGTITYTFYLNEALKPGETATLFEGITIPKTITKEDAAAIKESHIIVKADAIQTTDLGGVTNAKDAFAVVEGK